MEASMSQTVYGIVESRMQAEQLVQALIDAKINHGSISFLATQFTQFQDYHKTIQTSETNRNWRTEERLKNHPDNSIKEEIFTKPPENTTGHIEGTLGLLDGIRTLSISSLGPFITAGPLMTTLIELGAGGSIGGITGALVSSGIPQYEAKHYEDHLKEGKILLAVRASSDSVNLIKEVMQQQGIKNISISSEVSLF